MNRPAPRQWFVLWLGAIWTVLTLAIAEEYVFRGVFAALLITALLYWQFTPKPPAQSAAGQGSGPDGTAVPSLETVAGAYGDTAVIEQKVVGPVGVGGWLIWLIFGIAIVLPISCIGEILNAASTAEDIWDFAGSLVVLAAVAAGGIYTGIALGRGWPKAPRTALRFIIAVVVVSLFGFSALLSEGADPAETIGQAFGLLLWAALWSAYLQKSKRVKNTYAHDPSSEEPRRSTVRVGVAALAALLMWMGGAAYTNEQTRIDQRYEEVNPYQWMKATQQLDPALPDSFAAGVIDRLRPTVPNGTLTPIGSATFLDMGSVLRAVVRYTAEFGTDAGGTATVEGEMRTYFHPNGIASMESSCIPAILKCEEMQQLISEAERALLPRLNGTQLGGILPDGNCMTESVTNPNAQRLQDVVTCSYSDSEAASLSLTRSTLEQARRDMRSQIDPTPEFKRTLVQLALGAQ